MNGFIEWNDDDDDLYAYMEKIMWGWQHGERKTPYGLFEPLSAVGHIKSVCKLKCVIPVKHVILKYINLGAYA